jgi:hypothetical protein
MQPAVKAPNTHNHANSRTEINKHGDIHTVSQITIHLKFSQYIIIWFVIPVVFINYNWINQLSNTTVWLLDICCLLHRYQLHVSALMAIFRLID